MNRKFHFISSSSNDHAMWSSLQGLHAFLLLQAEQATDHASFLTTALPHLVEVLGAVEANVRLQDNLGNWQQASPYGAGLEVEDQLLSSSIDRKTPVFIENGCVLFLGRHQQRPHVFAIYGINEKAIDAPEKFAFLGQWLDDCLRLISLRQTTQARVIRLEQLLQIIERWQRSQDMLSLLNEMANSSTELFNAERASIFLWDKPNKQLVGRPALGVEGGELKIPDDRGVVGQVVKTGQPRRTDELEQKEIDRSVDKKLEFHTRNLLCVPLVGRRGKIFGAFELINKIGGNFTEADENGLMELAVHAATALEISQELQALINSRQRATEAAAAEIQMIGNSQAVEELRQKNCQSQQSRFARAGTWRKWNRQRSGEPDDSLSKSATKSTIGGRQLCRPGRYFA